MGDEKIEQQKEEAEDKFVLVKQCVCPSCKAPKVTPSRSFYIYCDYCATFMDTDYKFVGHQATVPEPDLEYDTFMQTMGQKAADAQASRDKDLYGQIYRRFIELQIKKYPLYYPPRIGDDAFKKDYIDYFVGSMVEREFNKELKVMGDKVTDMYTKITWKTVEVNGVKKTIISLEDLRKIYDVHLELTRASTKHFNKVGLVYPEKGVGLGLTEQLGMQQFIEGYLPYLLEDEQEQLLRESGLLGKYRKVLKPPLTIRHCGWCGAENSVVDNAKQVLCDSCGHTIIVSNAEFSCPGCHASISLPIGVEKIDCPYCDTNFKAVD